MSHFQNLKTHSDVTLSKGFIATLDRYARLIGVMTSLLLKVFQFQKLPIKLGRPVPGDLPKFFNFGKALHLYAS